MIQRIKIRVQRHSARRSVVLWRWVTADVDRGVAVHPVEGRPDAKGDEFAWNVTHVASGFSFLPMGLPVTRAHAEALAAELRALPQGEEWAFTTIAGMTPAFRDVVYPICERYLRAFSDAIVDAAASEFAREAMSE